MNNLKIIEDFINKQSAQNNLIINKVNEEILIFYLFVINNLSKKNGISLDFDTEGREDDTSADLFGYEKISIFNVTNFKKIEQLIKSNSRKIVFTDYKNFKVLQNKNICINGYNFANDLRIFLEKNFQITNQKILDYCIRYPTLIYSETSKYALNNQGYSLDAPIDQEINFILEIRRDIFELKKKNQVQELFFKIKEEVKYKRFNFLTY